jgi:hypothetical protein
MKAALTFLNSTSKSSKSHVEIRQTRIDRLSITIDGSHLMLVTKLVTDIYRSSRKVPIFIPIQS